MSSLIFWLVTGAMAAALVLILSIKDRAAVPSTRQAWARVAMIGAVPVALYALWGRPDLPDTPWRDQRAHALAPVLAAEQALLGERKLLVALRKSPKDVDLWRQLFQMYVAAGRMQAACGALRDGVANTESTALAKDFQAFQQDLGKIPLSCEATDE